LMGPISITPHTYMMAQAAQTPFRFAHSLKLFEGLTGKEYSVKRYVFPVVMVCLIAAGCARTPRPPSHLQRETARVVGDISPEQVKVVKITREIADVQWEADTPKGSYCRADDLLRSPYCSKQ
jgi:hypothetical protein